MSRRDQQSNEDRVGADDLLQALDRDPAFEAPQWLRDSVSEIGSTVSGFFNGFTPVGIDYDNDLGWGVDLGKTSTLTGTLGRYTDVDGNTSWVLKPPGPSGHERRVHHETEWTSRGDSTRDGFELEVREGVFEAIHHGETVETFAFAEFRATDDDGRTIGITGQPRLDDAPTLRATGEETLADIAEDTVAPETVAQDLFALAEAEGVAHVEAEVTSVVGRDGTEAVKITAYPDNAPADGRPQDPEIYEYTYEDGIRTVREPTLLNPSDVDPETTDAKYVELAQGEVHQSRYETPDQDDESGDTEKLGGESSNPRSSINIPTFEESLDSLGDVGVDIAAIETLDETLAQLSNHSGIVSLDEQFERLDEAAGSAGDGGPHLDLPSQERNAEIYGFPVDDADSDIATLDDTLAGLPGGDASILTLDQSLAGLPAVSAGDNPAPIAATDFLSAPGAEITSAAGPVEIAPTDFLTDDGEQSPSSKATSRDAVDTTTSLHAIAGGISAGDDWQTASGVVDLADAVVADTEFSSAGAALSSAAAFNSALAADNELAAAAHGVELGGDLGLLGPGDNAALGSAASTLGGLASIAHIDEAFAAGEYDAVLSGASAAANLAGQALGNAALTGAAETMSDVLPGASLGLNLIQGDVLGSAVSAVTMINPAVGVGLSLASSVFGGLFGSDPPPPPEAEARLALDEWDRYSVTGASDAHGGNGGSLAVAAQSAADLFNGIVASTGGRLIDTDELGAMTLRYRGEDVYANGAGVGSVGEGVERLVVDALGDAVIEGGDVHARRALLHQLERGGDLDSVLEAMETARAYSAMQHEAAALERSAEDPEVAAELAQYDAGDLARGALSEPAARVLEMRALEARAEQLGLDTPHPDEDVSELNRAFAERGVDLAGVSADDLVFQLDNDTLHVAIHDPDQPGASARELPHAAIDAGAHDFDGAAVHLPDGGTWNLAELMALVGVDSAAGSVHVASALAQSHGGMAAADVQLAGGGDTVAGTTGDDTLISVGGASVVRGLGGDDTFVSHGAGDTLIGGAGTDTVDYSASSEGVRVDLAAGRGRGGDAAGDVLASIEAVIGSERDDILVGDEHDNRLTTTGGDNVLVAGGGDNRLVTGDGDDRLVGGAGRDHLTSEDGSNRLDVGAGEGGVALGGRGDDLLVGHGNGAVLHGGDGVNAVAYDGSLADWALARHGETVFVERADGGGGRDQLSNIDVVQFDDAAVAVGDGAEPLIDGVPLFGVDAVIAAQARAAAEAPGEESTDSSAPAPAFPGAAPTTIPLPLAVPNTDDGGSDGDDVFVDGRGGGGRGRGGGGPREPRAAFSTGEAAALGIVAAGLPVVIDVARADAVSLAEDDAGVAPGLDTDGLFHVELASAEVSRADLALDSLEIDLPGPILVGRDLNTAPANGSVAGAAEDIFQPGAPVVPPQVTPPDPLDTTLMPAPGVRGPTAAEPGDTAGAADAGVDSSIGDEERIAADDTDDRLLESVFNPIIGTDGEDVLEGTRGRDWFKGRAGDDLIIAGPGADVIDGGAGRDTLSYELSPTGVRVALGASVPARGGDAEDDRIEGIEVLRGSLHGDDLRVAAGADGSFELHGVAGDNVLHGGAGADRLFAGTGDDQLFAGSGDNVLTGGEGDNLLVAGAGDDILRGVAGSNRLFGGSGADELFAGAGGDYLEAGSGDNVLTGGAGDDVLVAAAGDDVLRANAGDNELYGGSGRDELIGGSGIDYLQAGSGDNLLRAGDGAGDELVGGAGHDTLIGGSGNDTLRAGGEGSTGDELIAGSGDDFLLGGAGDDVLRAAGGDDTLLVTAGDNTLYGGSGNDRLTGGAGDDRLVAGDGDNVLIAGSGDDVLVSGERGLDTLIGGEGDNRLVVRAKDDFAFVDGGGGTNTLAIAEAEALGGDGERLALDVSAARNIDVVEGTSGNDDLTVSTDVDHVDLGAGFDRVTVAADPFDFAGIMVDGGAGKAVLEREDGTRMEIHAEELRFTDTDSGAPRTLFLDGRNNAPLVEAPHFEVTENGALTIDPEELLAGALDVDAGDQLSLASVGGFDIALSRQVSDAYWEVGQAPEFTPATAPELPVFQFGETELLRAFKNGFETVTTRDHPAGPERPVIESAGPRPDPVHEAGPAEELVQGHMLEELVRAIQGDSPSFGPDQSPSINREFGAPFHEDNTLLGNSEDNLFVGGGGANRFEGRGGSNTVDYTGSEEAVTVDLQSGRGTRGWAQGDTYSAIDRVRGSHHDDRLIADDAGSVLLGGQGDDTLVSGDGADVLIGGAGRDAAEFSGSRDQYRVLGNEDHILVTRETGAGDDAVENRLYGVEDLRFADRTMSVQTAPVTGEAFAGGDGMLRLEDGVFVYEPDEDFFDPEELEAAFAGRPAQDILEEGFAHQVDIPFTVADDRGANTTARASVDVEWVNRAPELFEPVDYEGTWDGEDFDTGGLKIQNTYVAAQGEGRILVTDREETGDTISENGDGFTFRIVEAPEYGRLDLDQDTGEFEYRLNKGADAARLGTVVECSDHPKNPDVQVCEDTLGRIDERDPVTGEQAEHVSFTVAIEDRTGGSIVETVTIENEEEPSGGGGLVSFPVTLDLDNSGLDFRDIDDSDVLADVNLDGGLERTAWLGEGTGLLALDRDGDGEVDLDGFRDISFVDDHPDARTDLEGLALAFDSNADGVFDARDARWDEFRVWTDASGDGETHPEELMTLAEAGISAIDLSHRGDGYTDGDVEVFGTTFFERTDGSRGLVGDTAFGYESAGAGSRAAPADSADASTGGASAVAGAAAAASSVDAEPGTPSGRTRDEALAEDAAARLLQHLAAEGADPEALPPDVVRPDLSPILMEADVRDIESAMA